MGSIENDRDLFVPVRSDDYYYYINLGHHYFKKRELDKAISSHTIAIKMFPSYYLTYYDRAMAYYLKGDLANALADYEKSKALDSKDLQRYLRQSDFYADVGKLEDLLADYIKSLQTSSLSAEVLQTSENETSQSTNDITANTTNNSSNVIDLKPKLAPRPYQTEALLAVERAYQLGKNRLLVALPTGTGKTVVFAHLIAKRSSLGRSLVIAHRDELLEQAADKIKMIMPDADLGVIKGERNEINAQILLASIQSLCRPSRLNKIKSDFATIIVDEAHHTAADSYRRVLKKLGCFSHTSQTLTLGVTATPERGDKVELHSVFQKIVYHRNIIDMIAQQYLCDLVWQRVDLDINLDQVKSSSNDFIEKHLINALNNEKTPKEILSAFELHASNRKTIVFVPGVELARQTAKLFQSHKIKCESVDGTLPNEERKAIINRFRSGETQVIINCQILTEGFDEPTVDAIILARPTQSKSFYLQMIGRGSRLYPGKENCLIVDLVGASTKYNLITIPTLFGLPSDKLSKKSVLTVAQEEALIRPQVPTKTQSDSNLDSEPTINQLDFQRLLQAQQKRPIRFNWIKVTENCLAISLTKTTIFLLKQNCGHWLSILRDADNSKTILTQHMQIQYAQGVAEDFVRTLNVDTLLDLDAHWRKSPASDKQLKLIAHLGITLNYQPNKGQAANLLSVFFAKKELNEDKQIHSLLTACKQEENQPHNSASQAQLQKPNNTAIDAQKLEYKPSKPSKSLSNLVDDNNLTTKTKETTVVNKATKITTSTTNNTNNYYVKSINDVDYLPQTTNRANLCLNQALALISHTFVKKSD